MTLHTPLKSGGAPPPLDIEHTLSEVAFLRSCSFSLWFLEQLAKKQAVDIGVTSNKVFIQQLLAPLLGRVVEGYRLMERTLPKGF